MAKEKRLIDANDVMARIEKTYGRLIANLDRADLAAALATVGDYVEQAPTVDAVEVVHGRWVMKETMIRSPFAKNAYCSVCLEETSYAHNYCPNCGAKMDGERREGE